MAHSESNRLVSSVFLAVLLAGCGGGDVSFTFSSEPDSASIDVSSAGDSATDKSTWQLNATQAEVSMSMGLGATGEVRLRLSDASGKQVLDQTISDTGTNSTDLVSEAGEAGQWTIQITAKHLDGKASISMDRYYP